MNDNEKKAYLEGYKQDKENGLPFFPDIIFKDAVVTLVVFLVLVALAYFVGAPLEERANPADTTYNPHPEWYFLFLFQLLKYFPGNLEVIGIVVLPTLAVIVLFLFPLIDRSPRRHFLRRPLVTGVTIFSVVGIIFLTVQSVRESPPPAEIKGGDITAALYSSNCAGCHGTSIAVQPGTNLHAIIAQGKHESMPAWNADLTTDEIDALAGFILSPGGSDLFAHNCAECHEVAELVSSDPLELRNALDLGKSYAAHAESDLPDWNTNLTAEDKASLLNFLIAPDGQRLFSIYCSACHGQSIAYSGDRAQLSEIISQGGLHIEMPPWRETLSETDIQSLADYVVNPASGSTGPALFESNCAGCHGERIPVAENTDQAFEMISGGGAHQSMPVWGKILTSAQLESLVEYTMEASRGESLAEGQQLFQQYCSACHGDFGEGGPNPAQANDVIAPISTSEYLKTRDDFTLSAIIAQGQPNLGMSAFGSSNGGPLSDDEIREIVFFIRSWQANPPVELPPEINADTLPLEGEDIYLEVCAQCHGQNGEGGIGPSLAEAVFQSSNSDQDIFDSISEGHPATAMIAWGEILSDSQILELVNFIRELEPVEAPNVPATPASPAPTSQPGGISFQNDLMPVLQEKCIVCHGNLGGWDASTYDEFMNSGDNAPVVIPGDPDQSLLMQKILGTQTEGMVMPPNGMLPDSSIQLFQDWIQAGAPNN